jgi:hypothetical protein
MPYNSAQNNHDSFGRLYGSIERVTFHSEATSFYMLRVKIKGQRTQARAADNAGKHRKYLGSGMVMRTQRSQKRLTNLMARLQ